MIGADAVAHAVHSDAATADATDWHQVLALYDQLLAVAPTPVVALNRAVAVAEVHGAERALAAIDDLALDDYHLYHAARAEMLVRLDHRDDARRAYDRAYDLTTNVAEKKLLDEKRRAL